MDGLDDLALAAAIGLPIVLVSAAGIYLALTGEAPASPRGKAGRVPAAGGPDEEEDTAAGGANR